MKPIHLTVFILWGALCTSLITYAGMLNIMTFGPAKEAPGSLAGIFALAAGLAAALSFVLRRVLLGGFRDGRLDLDSLSGRNRFVAGHLVVFALSESIGVLGFVNGLMCQGRPDAWLPFIGGSLVLLLLHIPLPSRFQPQANDYLRKPS